MLPPICDTFVWLCRSAEDARRRAVVEVILPENEAVLGGAASASSAAPTVVHSVHCAKLLLVLIC